MKYDAIIIGSGSSGGVLADRLTDETNKTVLLLEAGPDFATLWNDPSSPAVGELRRRRSIRANCTQGSTDTFHWGYAHGDGTSVVYGRNLGGSSSHNGYQSYRGTRLEHQQWPTGWNYDDWEPFYDRMENVMNVHPRPRLGMDPGALAFEEAALALGYPPIEDFNQAADGMSTGVGPNIWNVRGLADPKAGGGLIDKYSGRQGTLETFIDKARDRENLSMITDVFVDRINHRRGVAESVTFYDGEGTEHTVEGDLIISCANVFGSPTLLMRSGIGPGMKANLFHVGRNYRNQILQLMSAEFDSPIHPQLQYQLGITVQLDYDSPPDSLSMTTFAGGTTGLLLSSEWGSDFKAKARRWRNFGGAFVFPTHTESVGTVVLNQDKPNSAQIDYPIAQSDLDLLNRGIVKAQEIFAEINKLGGELGVVEGSVQPLPGIVVASHGHGTCRMGDNRGDSVVDTNLIVHGFENLMVVDGSVFPFQVQSPHLPISTLALKIADEFIRPTLWGI